MLDPPPPAGHDAPPFNGVTFLIINYLYGAALGVIITAAILFTDFGHLRTLLMADQSSWLALAVLTFGMAFTFAALYAGIAIMTTFRGENG